MKVFRWVHWYVCRMPHQCLQLWCKLSIFPTTLHSFEFHYRAACSCGYFIKCQLMDTHRSCIMCKVFQQSQCKPFSKNARSKLRRCVQQLIRTSRLRGTCNICQCLLFLACACGGSISFSHISHDTHTHTEREISL